MRQLAKKLQRQGLQRGTTTNAVAGNLLLARRAGRNKSECPQNEAAFVTMRGSLGKLGMALSLVRQGRALRLAADALPGPLEK